jgi:hypothetical protein
VAKLPRRRGEVAIPKLGREEFRAFRAGAGNSPAPRRVGHDARFVSRFGAWQDVPPQNGYGILRDLPRFGAFGFDTCPTLERSTLG